MTATAVINVKLGGAMVKYAPQGKTGSKHTITLPETRSVQSILDELQVPNTQPLMIILNEAIVARTDYDQTLLVDGDQLSLMQPIQAG